MKVTLTFKPHSHRFDRYLLVLCPPCLPAVPWHHDAVITLFCEFTQSDFAFAFFLTPFFHVIQVNHNVEAMTGILVSGLGAFCIIFAINSSVHSYLIVKYADGDKVAMNIGFYYMANAMGRFAGTLASGALYSFLDPNSVLVGFTACFWVSAALVFASGVVDLFIRDGYGGLKFGPLTLVNPRPVPPSQSDPALEGSLNDQAVGNKELEPTNEPAGSRGDEPNAQKNQKEAV